MEHGQRTAARAAAVLGAPLDCENLDAFLNNTACLRHPTRIIFDDSALEPHQFAQPVYQGSPEAMRCILHVRTCYRDMPEMLPLFVAYMAAAINYGEAATPELCESTAALLLRQDPAQILEALEQATG